MHVKRLSFKQRNIYSKSKKKLLKIIFRIKKKEKTHLTTLEDDDTLGF